jgi:hypothetical protein
MTRDARQRIQASLFSTIVVLGLVILAFGVDWMALLWGQPMSAPPKPAPTVIYLERVP